MQSGMKPTGILTFMRMADESAERYMQRNGVELRKIEWSREERQDYFLPRRPTARLRQGPLAGEFVAAARRSVSIIPSNWRGLLYDRLWPGLSRLPSAQNCPEADTPLAIP